MIFRAAFADMATVPTDLLSGTIAAYIPTARPSLLLETPTWTGITSKNTPTRPRRRHGSATTRSATGGVSLSTDSTTSGTTCVSTTRKASKSAVSLVRARHRTAAGAN